MRCLLFAVVLLVLCCTTGMAQGRYDANWVFGTKCGLRFNEDSTLSTFQTLSNNLEATASISDSAGNLLLYTSGIGNVPRSFYTIYDANNQVVSNGDSINGASTVTNGMQFIWQSKHRILLIQLVNDKPESCSSVRCIFPQFSVLEANDLGEWEVVKKNVVLPDSQVHEKLVTIKHANGRDTWLLLRETSSQSRGCSNRYYKYLITEDTVYKYGNQEIGYVSCHDFNLFGELFSNALGDRIVAIYPETKVIDLLGFNRCNGELQNLNQLSITAFPPYSGSFSMDANFLYIAGKASVAGVGGVLQYKLDSNGQVINKDTIYKVTNSYLVFGQMERAADNKIYVSSYIPPSNQNILENQYLSVINYPDSLGQSCQYEAFFVPLGDSCRTQLGLPNMPNYNLGATSIYQADAGVDTYICIGDTSIKGITIGGPAVSGVTYEWLSAEIDTTLRENSQLFVRPDSTTTYYLQLTDTTIQGSCQTRTDSVTIEIRDCTVDTTGLPTLTPSEVKVYPNPAHQQLHIEAPDGYMGMQFSLITLLGTTVLQAPLTGSTLLDIAAIPPGIYLYQISTAHNARTAVLSGKLVVE